MKTRQVDLSLAPRIALAEARARWQAGQALMVDVRDPESYELAHIPGALSLPLYQLMRRRQELPQGRELITY